MTYEVQKQAEKVFTLNINKVLLREKLALI